METLQHLLASLPESLRQNQFFSGGAVLALASWLGYSLRGWLIIFWQWLKDRLILEITVTNGDEVFDWFKAWIDAQPTMSRVRSVEVSLRNPDTVSNAPAVAGGSGRDNRPIFIVTPGLGTHLLWFHRRLVWFSRSRSDAPSGGSNSGYSRIRQKEIITLRFFTRDRGLIARLFNEVRDFNIPPHEDLMRVYSYTAYHGWRCAVSRDRKEVRNVILPAGVMEELERDVSLFRSSKDWYEEKGIPWRRGILLEGIPGSGKTSAAIELSRRTGQNIAVLSLSSSFFDDDGLMQAISSIPADTVMLFEDIDCVFRSRLSDEKTEVKTKVTFSGLLNAIDGVISADGVLILMSTNHAELLDPALLRPGRMDKRVKFTHADRQQARRMFAHFYPGTNGMSEEFASALDGRAVSMCQIQEHLVRHRDQPRKALAAANIVSQQA